MSISVSRRQFLLAGTAAAGLAVGVGATEAANVLAASPTKTISPGQDLMREHGVLKRVLLVYRAASTRIDTGQPFRLTALADGARIIHDYIEGFHEGLEEAYIFPRLTAAGRERNTVNTLLLQHGRGRLITMRVLALLNGQTTLPADALRTLKAHLDSFVRMYEPHEAREDTVIFPTFREITSSQGLHNLGVKFTRLEQQQFGTNAFRRMVGKVAAAEQEIGIADLAQFTPSETA